MICPNCNAYVSDSQLFCGNCGTKLADAAPATEPEASGVSPTETMPFASSYQAPADATAGSTSSSPYTQQQPSYASTQQTSYGTGQQTSYGAPYSPQNPAGQPYGQSPIPPGGYAPQTQQAPSNVPFGLSIAALVCTVIGLFPVGFVLAIVALVMNSNQKKQGVTSTKQTPTFVMSVISLVFSIFLTILVLLFGAAIIAGIESGEFDDLTSTPSSQVTTTTPSNSSTNSATATNTGNASASSAAATSTSSGAAATAGTIGSASSASAASENSLVGSWEIDSLESSDSSESITQSDLDVMRDMGMNVVLVLNEDGTMSFDMFGEVLEGTWTSSGANSAIVMIDGEPISTTLDGNLLVMTDGSDKLIFHRQQ